jgi:hypothetical protein
MKHQIDLDLGKHSMELRERLGSEKIPSGNVVGTRTAGISLRISIPKLVPFIERAMRSIARRTTFGHRSFIITAKDDDGTSKSVEKPSAPQPPVETEADRQEKLLRLDASIKAVQFLQKCGCSNPMDQHQFSLLASGAFHSVVNALGKNRTLDDVKMILRAAEQYGDAYVAALRAQQAANELDEDDEEWIDDEDDEDDDDDDFDDEDEEEIDEEDE